MSRLSHEQIATLLAEADSYTDSTKQKAGKEIRQALRDAYLEADAAIELKRVVSEQVRKIVRLEVEIGDLKERLKVKAEREPVAEWPPPFEPDGDLVKSP